MNESLRQQGLSAARQGKFRDAVDALSRYVSTGPEDDAEARLALAMSLSGLGQHDKALVMLDRLLSRQPNSAALHFNRGVVLEKLGRSDDAAAEFEKAVALNPRHVKARGRLSAMGRELPAAEEFLEVVAVENDIPEVEAVDPSEDPMLAVPLDVGEGDDKCVVREVGDGRLVLGGNAVWDIVRAALGVISLIGAVVVTVYGIQSIQENGFDLKTLRAVLATVLLYVLGIVGSLSLFRLGRRVTVDRDENLIELKDRLGLRVRSHSFHDCSEVRFTVGDRKPGGAEPCWVQIRGAGDLNIELGPVSAMQPASSVYLRVAAMAAGIIDVPLKVSDHPDDPHPELSRWLRRFGGDGRLRPASAARDRRIVHRPQRAGLPIVIMVLAAIIIVTVLFSASRVSGKALAMIVACQAFACLWILGGIQSIKNKRAVTGVWIEVSGGWAQGAGCVSIVGGLIFMFGVPFAVNIDAWRKELAANPPPAPIPVARPPDPAAQFEHGRIDRGLEALRSGDRIRISSGAAQIWNVKPNERRDEVVAELESHLNHADDIVRMRVCQALSEWGTQASIPKLQPLLNDPRDLVRMEAKKAIDKINKRP